MLNIIELKILSCIDEQIIKVADIDDIETLKALLKRKKNIIAKIEDIKDCTIRDIARLKYVDKYSWKQVANQLCFGNRDSMRMIFKRAFDKDGNLKDNYLKKW